MSPLAHMRWRIALLIIGFGGLGLVLWGAWPGLGPFLVGLVLAFLLMPLVDSLNKLLPRLLAILLVYALVITALALFGLYVAPIIVDQTKILINAMPGYIEVIQKWLNQTFTDVQQQIPQDFQQPITEGLNNFTSTAIGFIRDIIGNVISGIFGLAFGTIGFLVGVFIIPFWLFYVLKDKAQGMRAFYSLLPSTLREDAHRLVNIVSGTFNDYVRGQLIVAGSVGVLVTVGLMLVNIPASTAIFLGFIAGLFEVLPIIGPILGAIPAVLVAFFTGQVGNLELVLKVVIVFVIVQQIEGNLLIPKIAGESTNLHPAIVMLVIIIGSELGGLAGAIAAVPITAVVRDLYIYLYQRLALGVSPLEAESHVPSRRDEIAAEKRRQAQRSLKRPALVQEEVKMPSPSQSVNPVETLPLYDKDKQETENR
ncbi:MAG: AI-2E family transporter [Chloroflexota bacterium]